MAYTTINKSTDYFNTKLYTGNGGSNAITGVGFQPDWTWIKKRSATGSHCLFDAVRGNTKRIQSNTTGAETTETTAITSFDSDGFTLGSGGTANGSGTTLVSWNWKANGAGSANSDGSTASTVSANTTSGFSIVKWTGNGGNATIGHGLGAVPKMIIIKSLANTTSWMLYTAMSGNDSEIYLNGTNVASSSSTAWQDTTPTSSVFYVAGGSGDGVNASGDYIAYCFAEVQGFSKFSKFIGNGDADGPFLNCGFKPAFILLKNATDGAKNWEMLDNQRPSTGQNPADDILFPDTTDAESASQTDRLVDFTSTGIKIRGNSAQMNSSGQTHIYMAFAAAPLVGTNNIPATAR